MDLIQREYQTKYPRETKNDILKEIQTTNENTKNNDR